MKLDWRSTGSHTFRITTRCITGMCYTLDVCAKQCLPEGASCHLQIGSQLHWWRPLSPETSLQLHWQNMHQTHVHFHPSNSPHLVQELILCPLSKHSTSNAEHSILPAAKWANLSWSPAWTAPEQRPHSCACWSWRWLLAACCAPWSSSPTWSSWRHLLCLPSGPYGLLGYLHLGARALTSENYLLWNCPAWRECAWKWEKNENMLRLTAQRSYLC